MNERIKRLRLKSISTTVKVCVERARLLTEFYKKHQSPGLSVPVMRSKALHYILSNKKLFIDPDEWIIGERGQSPKYTSTYPEICLHTLNDLDGLHHRKKIPFFVNDAVREAYEKEIIPYWKNNTIRDRIFSEMSNEWMEAYEAGVFTEFLEQRAPGHTVAGNTIFKKGMKDISKEIERARDTLDFKNDPMASEKLEELKAMDISANAIVAYARRNSDLLREMADNTNDTNKKEELLYKSKICEKVPEQAPGSFHEALQFYWFIHIGVITELNPWDSFNPGRLDQNLYPFYKNDINEGILTKDKAKEILQSFWIKFNNHPAPPKVGVTAKESSTYTDFSLINVGGLTEDGKDGVNELTFLILDVIEEMRLLQPGSMVQISKKNPDCLIKRALKIIRTGFGQPSLFNTDAIIQELLIQGKSIKDARNGGASGCVETGAFGKESYILSGYFNLAKILEITLHNGLDPRTGRKIGIESGKLNSFEDLLSSYGRQLKHFANIKIQGNNKIAQIYAKYMPAPFLSLIIDDCIAKGKDYNNGGARYNTTYIQGVGLGSTNDSLTALQYHVYDKKNLGLKEFREIMMNNYTGHEEFRYTLLTQTPKYGNDNDYADSNAEKVFEKFYDSVNDIPCSRGGVHRINLLPTTCHIYFGSVTGALPDGRKANGPLSEGISPVQGADTSGPTAVIKSASKIDHIRTGGTLLNLKFSPDIFNHAGTQKILYMIRSYFRLDGHHIQFNVISGDTLKRARKDPLQYRDLIVRVAGYSDYFNDLSNELQDEIIKRTEHKGGL